MTVYLDLVFLLNFMVDLLLLTAANRLTGHPCLRWRMILAAAIGGIYGGLCVIPGSSFLGSSVCRVASFVVISLVAYGLDQSVMQRGAVFAFLCMSLGGMAGAIGAKHMLSLLFCAASILVLCWFGFYSGIGRRKYVHVSMKHRGKEHIATALVDTGNVLTDPITGCQVMIAAADAAAELLGLSEPQLRDPVVTLQNSGIPGLRLIPYRSVGNGNGMLLAAKLDTVIIDGREVGAVVAFAADSFRKGDPYQALTGGVL